MSNIVTIDSSFAVTRVLRSGKVQTRGALGIMTSGNRAETGAMGLAITKRLIENNTFTPVVREMVRAFSLTAAKPAVWRGKKGEVAPVGAVIRVTGVGYMKVEAGGTLSPVQAVGQIDVSGGVGKAQALAIAETIIEKCAGKEMKGEKAFYLQAARTIVDKCNEQHDVADAAVAGADALLSA